MEAGMATTVSRAKKAAGRGASKAAKKAAKRPARNASARKAAAKKTVAKKAAAKKVVAKKAAPKKPVAKKPAARKVAAKKVVAKKVAAKQAPARKVAARPRAAKHITPAQALANTRRLLEAKHAHDREAPPWQALEARHGTTPQGGFQDEQARDQANELHAGESRMDAIQGAIGTQDRHNQGKRDQR
jgi:hypothetical protein